MFHVEGSIFWSYGLVTFARFLGTFSEIGWAWNRAPSAGFVSAEFVESLVIFLYGATNMWMERFGANAGDPFTTKQIQHISIAVNTTHLINRKCKLTILLRSCSVLLALSVSQLTIVRKSLETF